MLTIEGHEFEIRPSASAFGGFDAVVARGPTIEVGERIGYGRTREEAEHAARANMPRRLRDAGYAASAAPPASAAAPTETKRPVEAAKELPMSPTEKKIRDTYGAEAHATWRYLHNTLGAAAALTYERSLASTSASVRREHTSLTPGETEQLDRAFGRQHTRPLIEHRGAAVIFNPPSARALRGGQ